MSAPNLIHGLTLDVAWEGSVEAGESLADWLREALLPVIDQVLSRSAVAGQLRRVERLEVDLGMVTRDEAEEELPNRLQQRLTEALHWPAQASPQWIATGGSDASSERESGVPDGPGEQLLGFLRSGRLPWSVAADRQVAHEQLLRRVLATRQASAVLSEVVRDEHMLARLVRQFSAAALSEVVAVLHPGQAVPPAATEAQWSAALQGQGAVAPELDKFMAWRQHQLDLDEQSLPLADLQQWLIWWLMHDSSLVNQDCSLMLESIGAQCGRAPDPVRFMQLVLSTLRAGGQLDLEALVHQSGVAAERPAAMDAITTLKSQAAIRNFVAQHAAEDKRLGNLNSAQLHQLVRGWIGDGAPLFLGAIESRALQTGDAHGYFRRILQNLLDAREIDLEAACGESAYINLGSGPEDVRVSHAATRSGKSAGNLPEEDAVSLRTLSTSPKAGAGHGRPLSDSPEAGAGNSLSTLPASDKGDDRSLSASPETDADIGQLLSTLPAAGNGGDRPLSGSPEAKAVVDHSLSTPPAVDNGDGRSVSASPEADAAVGNSIRTSPVSGNGSGRPLNDLAAADAGIVRSLSTLPGGSKGGSRPLSALTEGDVGIDRSRRTLPGARNGDGRPLSDSLKAGAGVGRSLSASPDAGNKDGRPLDASSEVGAAASPVSAGEAKALAEESARGSSPLPALLQQNLPQRLASAMLQADLTSLEIIWPEITRYHADVLLAAAQRYLRRPQERASLAARAPTDILIAMLKAISPSSALLIEPVIRHADACNAVLSDPLPPDEFRHRSLQFALDCALSAGPDGSLIDLITTLAPKHAKPDDIRQIAHAWRVILPASPVLDSALFGARYVQAIQEHLRAPEDDTPPAVYTLLSEEICQHYLHLLEAPLREQLEASISTARQPAPIAKAKKTATPAGGGKKARPDGTSSKKSRQRKQDAEQQFAAPPAAIIQAESTLAILLMRADEPGKPEQLAAELMLQRLLGSTTTLTGALETALSQPAAISRLVDMTPGIVLAQLLVRLQPELAAQLPHTLRAIASHTGIANIPALQASATWQAIYQAAFMAADPVTPTEFIRTLVHKTAGRDTPLPDTTPTGGSASDIMRTLLQPLTRAEEQHAPATQEEPQAQQGDANLRNAGMVIFATYAQRLFSILELTKDGNFVSEEAAQRAVHLLQYAVTAETSTPEYQLVLNKLLCGIHGGQPIARGIDITDKEKDTIAQMLNGVIAHWKALGKTSISGLRQTFLQREGQLTFEENAWHLKIPTATFDMLLDRLPWSFAMIKFPWMEHPLHVTWR
ncbi:contractile injection system tape measure protein [Duganella sp.]|uniref:contractile injection system tape measure protein n=1 Tax=Duganella sp. TaxID=1904440 RepID=UPI0031CF1798